MWSRAASLGAPVTEPGGKVASMASAHPSPSRSVPSTVLTRWTRPGACSTDHRAGTLTDPYSHTRPKPLRTRTTIITFSARSLSVSGSGVGAVPLIGDDQMRRPDRERNRSGDADATATPRSGPRTPAHAG